MKISTKGRYALRMMLDLAQHQNDGHIALKDIAERQNVSKKYLEQIVPILIKGGFLKTNRGYRGGYMLVKPPREYTVKDILQLTEGSLAPVECGAQYPPKCQRYGDCLTLPLWQGLYGVVCSYLEAITLQDLLDGKTIPWENTEIK